MAKFHKAYLNLRVCFCWGFLKITVLIGMKSTTKPYALLQRLVPLLTEYNVHLLFGDVNLLLLTNNLIRLKATQCTVFFQVNNSNEMTN